jgi:HNH endonuclease
MGRRSRRSGDLEGLCQQAVDLLANFKAELAQDDLRKKVLALVPAVYALRQLGASLIPDSEAPSARDRILAYLQRYPMQVIDGDELAVVSGIGEWARRLRELRTKFGWSIYSGSTFKDIAKDRGQAEELAEIGRMLGLSDLSKIKPDQYVLVSEVQDLQAATRWNVLNDIRKTKISVTDKILTYLLRNIGVPVTGEELRYLAKDKSEWPRRTRELRTEEGWQVKTRSSGRPDLPVAVYVLESDRQAPEHDRKIPDDVRVAVLKRDGFKCAKPDCRWHRGLQNPDDPRSMLELHHIDHHAQGGQNTVKNLITLCNVHHDAVHRETLEIQDAWISSGS